MKRFHFLKVPPVNHVCIKWDKSLSSRDIYKLKYRFLRLIQSSGLQLQCFVIMSNHLHFIAHGTDEELLYISENLGGQFWRKQIKSWTSLKETYRYILRNPVDAGIAIQVEDYAFSSLRHVLNNEEPYVFIYDPMYVHLNAAYVLNWLNGQELKPQLLF